MMKRNKAFTLGEMLIAFGLVGVLTGLTTSVMKGISVTQDTMAMKKANQTIHEVVNNIISDGSSYMGDNDFSDLSTVVLKIDNKDVTISGKEKFAKIFYSKLKLLQSPFRTRDIAPRCMVALSDKSVQTDNCYESVDGILWGVPLTDFKKYNVFEIKRNGFVTAYVPVTVYVNYRRIKNKGNFSNSDDAFKRNAIIFAVRQDGDIRVVNTVDCDDSKNKNFYQCKVRDIVSDVKF